VAIDLTAHPALFLSGLVVGLVLLGIMAWSYLSMRESLALVRDGVADLQTGMNHEFALVEQDLSDIKCGLAEVVKAVTGPQPAVVAGALEAPPLSLGPATEPTPVQPAPFSWHVVEDGIARVVDEVVEHVRHPSEVLDDVDRIVHRRPVPQPRTDSFPQVDVPAPGRHRMP
jgi:hypothetical protein